MKNGNWLWKPLGDLFEIGAGKTMSPSAREGGGRVPFLRTSNVLWDEIDVSQLDEMAMSPVELEEKCVAVGDLLVCEGGEIGRAAVWDGQIHPLAFQNHLHRLRRRQQDVEPRFYVYFLQSAFTQLGIFEGAANRTTIPNLSRNRLAALDVPHPPIHEQRAIVGTLALVRSAIRGHAGAATQAEELKRAAMHSIFTRGLRGDPQKETEIGLAPESWTVGPVGDLAEFQRGFDITKSEQSAGNIPVVSSGGVKSYHDKAAAHGPGVLVGRKGSIGVLHYVETDYWPHDTTLWCKDFRGNSPKFLFYRLHSLDMKRLDSGAANPALNRNFLHSEIISWPSTGEQSDIVAILDAIERKIDLHRRKRALLDELFRSLLYKLMTGEVCVSSFDPSLVPAGAGPRL